MTRIVVVTGSGPEHRYVANAIAGRFDVAAILVCAKAAPRGWRTVLRKYPSRFLDKAALRVFEKVTGADAARTAALRAVLGPASDSFEATEKVSEVGRPRDGTLQEHVARLQPDVLAIYGTSIIPDDVLTLAKDVALNMHTGLSPQYRGTACAFWPVHDGRPDCLGATVHECTSDIDGGRVFARARSGIVADDTLHHVFARAVVAGTAAYLDVLDAAIAGTLSGQPQDLSSGREMRGLDRGLVSELVARRNLRRIGDHVPET